MMRFGRRQVLQRTIYLTLGIVSAALLLGISILGLSYRVSPRSSEAQLQKSLEGSVSVALEHKATDKLISKLKKYGLWKINPSQEVPPFFIESFPPDLNAVGDISLRKRVFLHSLLPHALFVRQEALGKREKLDSILSKIDCPLDEINFDPEQDYGGQCAWSDSLAAEEVRFIRYLCSNYRTTTAQGLLERVDAVPISIILAQGALESSWGSSRFAREGNSVFGMWTWKTEGMVPLRRDEGKTHKVKAYENVLDSVRAYQLTLNRLDYYEEFRLLRRQTDDPLILAEGLSMYSERGEEYVEEIKKVILSNDLQKYDSCSLTVPGLSGFSGPVSETGAIAESGNASL